VRLCWSRRVRLALIAAAIAVPIAGLVAVLDLIAWQTVDPAAEGASQRRLGDAVRTVDGDRMTALAVARYALGALAYALIIAASIRSLTAGGREPPGADRRGTAADRPDPDRWWRRRPGRDCRAWAATVSAIALALVVAVRLMLSVTAAAVLAGLATSSPEAYLLALNLTYAVAKILTAPFLAAVLVVVTRPDS
jgi:hypothetical protein